jgi:hypothetical protein
VFVHALSGRTADQDHPSISLNLLCKPNKHASFCVKIPGKKHRACTAPKQSCSEHHLYAPAAQTGQGPGEDCACFSAMCPHELPLLQNLEAVAGVGPEPLSSACSALRCSAGLHGIMCKQSISCIYYVMDNVVTQPS